MTRITNFAANAQLINEMLRTQTRIFNLQNQVTSEKKSQDYSGISIVSQRLINLENTRDSLQQYISNNDSMMTQLDITAVTVEGIRTVISDFQKALIDFKVGNPFEEERVTDIQKNAFDSLKSMEGLLNTSVDGRFLFSGARVSNQAVNFGLTDIGAYQAKFDGSTVQYPTTRDAQLANFAISQTEAFDTKTFNSGAIAMTFDDTADTIAAAAGTFRYPDGTSLPVGTTITTTGAANGANNSTFTIASVSADGTTATLSGAPALVDFAETAVTAVAETPLTFADVGSADTITGPADTFKDAAGNLLGAGTQITVTNTTSNNGTFTIASVSTDGTTATLVSTDTLTAETDGSSTVAVAKATNFLTFERADSSSQPQSRITAQGAQFANVDIGSFITVSGTASNDGTYEVLSKPSNGEIVVRTEMFTDETATAASIAAADGTRVDSTTTGNLTFVRDNTGTPPLSRVSAAVAGSLSSILVGQKISINSAAPGPPTNNGTYTVVSNNGTDIDIATKMLTDEGTSATPHLTYTSATSEVTFGANTAPTKDTILAAAGSFSTLSVGMSVTVSGATTSSNNQVYTIAEISSDGSKITVNEEVAAAAPDANAITFLVPFADGTVTATPYFQGVDISMTHRVDKNRDFEFDFNAADPAFEKAIRAMMMIAQGTFQSEGGLDQNNDRVTQAQYLLDSSLKRTVVGTAPFGTELSGNLEQMGINIAIDQILVQDTNAAHEDFIGFLDSSISDFEQADPLETITRLIDDQRQLEVSFQALSTIRRLTLLNFL